MTHRSILLVFKTIALTMIIIVVADLFLTVTDVFNVNKQVNSLATSIKAEVRSNNAIPEDMAESIDEQLKDIAKRSLTVSKNPNAIRWNWKTSTSDDEGNVYEPINEDNVKDYGESIDIHIQVDFAPKLNLFQTRKGQGTQNVTTDLITKTQDYVYPVIGLRNLK